jgi:opacity protein-like surface antigen
MTKKITMKTLLLAGALAFGLGASSFAQSTGASVPAPGSDTGKGLLGQSYVNLGYSYTDAHKKPFDIQGLNFDYNQPLNTGFDLNVALGDNWSSQYSRTRFREVSAFANAIAFIHDLSWGKPFIGVGAGYIRTKFSGSKDWAFAGDLSTGVEFQVTKDLSITPVATYTDTTSSQITRENRWEYGVKANYWITSDWALSAGVSRDNQVDTTYSIGTTFRF